MQPCQSCEQQGLLYRPYRGINTVLSSIDKVDLGEQEQLCVYHGRREGSTVKMGVQIQKWAH